MEVNKEMFEMAPVVNGTAEDMQNFHQLIEKLEVQGQFKTGPVVFIPHESFKPDTIPISRVRKMWVKRNRQQEFEPLLPGYYNVFPELTSQFNPEANPLMTLNTTKISEDLVQVATLFSKGMRPKGFLEASTEEICSQFWEHVEKGKGTMTAVCATDVRGSLFRNGKSMGTWTVDSLDHMIHKVLDTWNGPVVWMTPPRLNFGTWLSHSVQQLEYKNTWMLSYLHWGKPRICIFLYPEDRAAFEKAMLEDVGMLRMEIVDHVCKAIFDHKKLLVNPAIIHGKGFRMKMVVQERGQFVIIPPSTYRFGFSSGLNVVEACNFTTKSWLASGLLAQECSEVEKFKTIDMELFVFGQMKEHYAEYVNGTLKVMDSFGKTNEEAVVVEKEKMEIQIQEHDFINWNSNVWNWNATIDQFYLAKTENGVEYVYVKLGPLNGPRREMWLRRDAAEKLFWLEQKRAVRFPDFIFNMELATLKIFPKVARVLRNYVGDSSKITLEYLQKAKVKFFPDKGNGKSIMDAYYHKESTGKSLDKGTSVEPAGPEVVNNWSIQ